MKATTLDKRRVPASHLNAGALSHIRAELVADRQAREALIAKHEAAVAELTGQADNDSNLERELADAAIARASEAIRDIDAALARIDDGTYGLCVACDAEILFERLQVIPEARLCVGCSGRRGGVLG